MIDFSTHQTDNGTLVIRLGGQLDADATTYFFDCVEGEIEGGHERIVVNCADLGYISSVGLGALIRARARVAKSGGQIFMARVNATIMNMLQIVNLDRVFDIYPTEQEAIEAIEK